ncbi:transketolase [Rhodobacteraceae bacterium CYK-10]|uniref:Transketolase n=2 Tax=Stagnihabitans tardus TaxID=2699202 RepID=A0AAE4YG90_9RHOB|nr:transketolase [Stagnihabitans tardus]
MASALRALAMDAVEEANSGHPGMPLGFADVATVLYADVLKFDPSAPDWADRDRLVLSAGHGSMLLYGLLHLTGYPGWNLEVLRRFRQLGSPAAGHPEFGHGAGIETTTGPLGQGLATAVGMAMAEAMDRARFGADLVDHRTWVIAGDGCLMEGIAQEAISLAGHLRLSRLIVLFDDNGITIDGKTSLATSEDQAARFRAAGWRVLAADGHDPVAIKAALDEAVTDTDRPTMVAFRTQIGRGAGDKAGTAKSHGSPLGCSHIAAARAAMDWPHAPFVIPAEITDAWAATSRRGKLAHMEWATRLQKRPPAEQQAFTDHVARRLPDFTQALDAAASEFLASGKPLATRAASGKVLEHLIPLVPALIGGSADLTGSVNTRVPGHEVIAADAFGGRFVHWGIREHGMAAAMNGMALHGGYVPYSGTFLVFAGYMLGAMRLSALMGQKVVYVLTHDSIGLGEDGPTHQPVESLAQLRAMPGLTVLRPGDPVEVAEAWGVALAQPGPVALVLSRQAVPVLRKELSAHATARGAYVLSEAKGGPRQVTLIGTGTELALAVEAQAILAAEGIRAAVVSMPSMELFAAQDEAWQDAVLGPCALPRVAVEAALRFGWDSVLGRSGRFVGMTGFGASGPAEALYDHFGITAAQVAEAARAALAKGARA